MRDLPRFRIHYYDEERSPDVVVIGHWELVLAERKFSKDEVQQGSLDALAFQAFMGAKRGGLVPDGATFDSWARDVCEIEDADAPEGEDGQGESPAPPAK